MNHTTERVAAAVVALAAFAVTDPDEAVRLLTMWERRYALTASDLIAIREHYTVTGR